MSTITLQVHRRWEDMKLAESIAQAWKLPSHKSSPCLWIQLLYKRSNSLLLWEKGCNSLKYIPHCLYGHICLCQISTKPFKKWCFTQIGIQALRVKNHTMLNVSFNESVSLLKGNWHECLVNNSNACTTLASTDNHQRPPSYCGVLVLVKPPDLLLQDSCTCTRVNRTLIVRHTFPWLQRSHFACKSQ